MSLSINALYDSRDDAQSAKSTLIAAGIPEEGIRLIVCPSMLRTGHNELGATTSNADALCRLLQEVGLPQEAQEDYHAKLTDGGAMLNLPIKEAETERVMGILKDHGSVDVERRVAIWGAEGWGGTSPVSTEGWGGYSATSTGGTKITTSED